MPPKKHTTCLYGSLLPRMDENIKSLTKTIELHIEKQSDRDGKQFDSIGKLNTRVTVVETVLKKNGNNAGLLDSILRMRKGWLGVLLLSGMVGVNLVGDLLSVLGAWLKSVSVAFGG